MSFFFLSYLFYFSVIFFFFPLLYWYSERVFIRPFPNSVVSFLLLRPLLFFFFLLLFFSYFSFLFFVIFWGRYLVVSFPSNCFYFFYFGVLIFPLFIFFYKFVCIFIVQQDLLLYHIIQVLLANFSHTSFSHQFCFVPLSLAFNLSYLLLSFP